MTLHDITMWFINEEIRLFRQGKDPAKIDVLIQVPILPFPLVENHLEIAAVLKPMDVEGGFVMVVPGKPV